MCGLRDYGLNRADHLLQKTNHHMTMRNAICKLILILSKSCDNADMT